MNIYLIKHHIPSLIQTKTKYAYVSSYCCFCDINDIGSRIFRVNLKLKVFKCYNCGISGKNDNSFIRLLKISKIKYLESAKAVSNFEVQLCKTKEVDSLPF